jgi:hypothetical protein
MKNLFFVNGPIVVAAGLLSLVALTGPRTANAGVKAKAGVETVVKKASGWTVETEAHPRQPGEWGRIEFWEPRKTTATRIRQSGAKETIVTTRREIPTMGTSAVRREKTVKGSRGTSQTKITDLEIEKDNDHITPEGIERTRRVISRRKRFEMEQRLKRFEPYLAAKSPRAEDASQGTRAAVTESQPNRQPIGAKLGAVVRNANRKLARERSAATTPPAQ